MSDCVADRCCICHKVHSSGTCCAHPARTPLSRGGAMTTMIPTLEQSIRLIIDYAYYLDVIDIEARVSRINDILNSPADRRKFLVALDKAIAHVSDIRDRLRVVWERN